MSTYAKAYNWVLRVPGSDLAEGPKLLYVRLRQYGEAGNAFPSIGTLSRELGRDKRTVRRWLDRLVEVKLVRRKLRREQRRSSVYTFPPHPWEGLYSRRPSTPHPQAEGGDPVPSPEDRSVPTAQDNPVPASEDRSVPAEEIRHVSEDQQQQHGDGGGDSLREDLKAALGEDATTIANRYPAWAIEDALPAFRDKPREQMINPPGLLVSMIKERTREGEHAVRERNNRRRADEIRQRAFNTVMQASDKATGRGRWALAEDIGNLLPLLGNELRLPDVDARIAELHDVDRQRKAQEEVEQLWRDRWYEQKQHGLSDAVCLDRWGETPKQAYERMGIANPDEGLEELGRMFELGRREVA